MEKTTTYQKITMKTPKLVVLLLVCFGLLAIILHTPSAINREANEIREGSQELDNAIKDLKKN